MDRGDGSNESGTDRGVGSNESGTDRGVGSNESGTDRGVGSNKPGTDRGDGSNKSGTDRGLFLEQPNYVKVQRKTGGVVVDWYAIDIGEGDVTFAQLIRATCGLFHVVHQVYYYSAQVKSRALTILPLVCWMCGETNTLPIPPEKLQEFQCFHPVCHGEKTAKEEAAKKEAAKEEATKVEAVKEDETRIR
ncbi:hypothetical protein Bbelb_375890 [Branchiostoma belcheri]|nr:hypothetical protein Bbelb_375890 [Branchiostoma belcheri]